MGSLIMLSESRSSLEANSLHHYTRLLRPYLADPGVTELCLQKPGEFYLEDSGGWRCVPAPFATLAWARHFSRLLATFTDQRVNDETPLLSATLPEGERVQVVLPPATVKDQVVMAVRRPNQTVWSVGALAERHFFKPLTSPLPQVTRSGDDLSGAFAAKDWAKFLSLAVKAKLTIVVAGATGSGKTTLTKALIQEISPDERLISIEDAAELDLSGQPNSVRLFYSKDDQGRARVSAKQLLEACLRLRPDRILLAELRGEEAYYFLRNVSSGHPGSITSIHAGSTALAFEQLALLVKESVPGRELAFSDILSLLHGIVDVVVHCVRCGTARGVSDVYWRASEVNGSK